MEFHKNYSNLVAQLPPSLIKNAWNRLTIWKTNPLSIAEASNINLSVETFLRNEVDKYNRKKRMQCKTSLTDNAMIIKDQQIAKLFSTVSLSNRDMQDIKKALASAEKSINILKNRCQ